MSDPGSWRNHIYEDRFYDLHGHFPEQADYECPLCNKKS